MRAPRFPGRVLALLEYRARALGLDNSRTGEELDGKPVPENTSEFEPLNIPEPENPKPELSARQSLSLSPSLPPQASCQVYATLNTTTDNSWMAALQAAIMGKDLICREPWRFPMLEPSTPRPLQGSKYAPLNLGPLFYII